MHFFAFLKFVSLGQKHELNTQIVKAIVKEMVMDSTGFLEFGFTKMTGGSVLSPTFPCK